MPEIVKYKYIDDVVGIEIMNTSSVSKDIEIFEDKYNVKLPIEYRKFMLEYNGGSMNNIYMGDMEEPIYISIRNFLSFSKRTNFGNRFNSEFEYCNHDKAEEQKYEFETILPYKEVLMIAWDEGDNSILISCEEEDYGCIYFQHHEDRDEFTITKIADSFNGFIADLKHDPVMPGSLGRDRMLRDAREKNKIKETLEYFRKQDERFNKPIYRELKVELYDN